MEAKFTQKAEECALNCGSVAIVDFILFVIIVLGRHCRGTFPQDAPAVSSQGKILSFILNYIIMQKLNYHLTKTVRRC